MEVFQNLSHFKDLSLQTAITIGTFDGVHLGHRTILERLINTAKSTGLKSAVLTFFPHPRMVLQQDADIKLLNTLEEKTQMLEALGLDYLVVHPFTEAFSKLSPTAFVHDLLIDGLKAKIIIIGYDHRFGQNRTAGIQDLRAFGAKLNFEVEEIPAQEVDAVSISSTKIRKALLHGDIATANRYLGAPYPLTGTVTPGKKLGQKIGFPTANLHIAEAYKLIPQNGVYVVKSTLGSKVYFGMMNIGLRPTVGGTQRTIEVHFFDFHGDLYNTKIQVGLLHRLRNEHKFSSVTALQEQLNKDKAHSLALLSKMG